MVIIAVGMTLFVVLAAIVIDLGLARTTEQDNDISVDQAALAGVSQLEAGDGEPACVAAWSYLRANEAIDAADIAVAPSCGNLAGPCDVGAARTTSAFALGKVFTFTSPVPVGDPMLDGQPYNPSFDGDACERFGVSIDDASSNMIAGGSIDLFSSAVAVRSDSSSGIAPAALILLDPTGCNVLRATGSARVRALANASFSGAIAVDSDASDCPSNGGDSNAAVNLDGNVWITAEGPDGQIASYAMGEGDAAEAYRRPDWGGTFPAEQYTTPDPVSERHGRQIVDDRYGVEIADLRAEWSTTSGLPDAGFQRWTEWIETNRSSFPGFAFGSFGDPCHIGSGPYEVDVPVGNWYIDCPSGLQFSGNGKIAFRGGNVVMDAPLTLAGTTPIAFNCPSGDPSSCGDSTDDSIIVVRSGDFIANGDTTSVRLPRTFIHIEAGTFDLDGDKQLFWTAPLSGPFEDLLVWTESSDDISFVGNGSIDAEGIFFAPNAHMRVDGSRDYDNFGVQTFLESLLVTGDTRFTVYPVPDRHASLPAPGGVSLVR